MLDWILVKELVEEENPEIVLVNMDAEEFPVIAAKFDGELKLYVGSEGNAIQFDLLKELVGEANPSIFFVEDGDEYEIVAAMMHKNNEKLKLFIE